MEYVVMWLIRQWIKNCKVYSWIHCLSLFDELEFLRERSIFYCSKNQSEANFMNELSEPKVAVDSNSL